MDKFDLLSFNIIYQTEFLNNSSKYKIFQMAHMKEEDVIVYSNNSLQCGYL